MKKFIACILLAAMSLGICGCDDYSDFLDETAEYSDDSYAYKETEAVSDTEPAGYDFAYEDSDITSARDYPYFSRIGSAGDLKGTTLIITIFSDDAKTSWELDKADDLEAYSMAYSNIGIAADWITQAAAPYSDAAFLWDWVEYPDLVYFTNTSYDMNEVFEAGEYADLIGAYEDFWGYIDANIPTEQLMEKYGAENAVYLALFDSDFEQTITSRTRSWADASWMSYPYEVAYMFIRSCGSFSAPAGFAHEILHCFGAPDLYISTEYGITDEYVQWAKEQKINDIMRVTFDNEDNHTRYYDHISNEMTDITLYYLGLTDYSETVAEWGFESNQHIG